MPRPRIRPQANCSKLSRHCSIGASWLRTRTRAVCGSTTPQVWGRARSTRPRSGRCTRRRRSPVGSDSRSAASVYFEVYDECGEGDAMEVVTRERYDEALAALAAIRALVDEQAEDEGLWFIAGTAPEAYLQQ